MAILNPSRRTRSGRVTDPLDMRFADNVDAGGFEDNSQQQQDPYQFPQFPEPLPDRITDDPLTRFRSPHLNYPREIREPELKPNWVKPENRFWDDPNMKNDRGSIRNEQQYNTTIPPFYDANAPDGGLLNTPNPNNNNTNNPNSIPDGLPKTPYFGFNNVGNAPFEGFNFNREQNPTKSVKDAAAIAVSQAFSKAPPPDFSIKDPAAANAYFEQYVKPIIESYGHKVHSVNGDKFTFTSGSGEGTFEVDWIRGWGAPGWGIAWQTESSSPQQGFNNNTGNGPNTPSPTPQNPMNSDGSQNINFRNNVNFDPTRINDNDYVQQILDAILKGNGMAVNPYAQTSGLNPNILRALENVRR